MIKKKLSKILTITGVTILITCNASIPVLANTGTINENKELSEVKEIDEFEDRVELSLSKSEMKRIVNSDQFLEKATRLTEELIKEDSSNIDIENVKKAQDFAGNTYTVVECVPLGYYILHDSTGQYVEYSDESKSPYLGYNGELFYGGPMEYYVNNKGKYYHTLDGTSIVQKEDINEASQSSEMMNDRLEEKINDSAVAFLLEKELDTDSVTSKESLQNAKQAVSKASATAATYWATNSSIISRQNNNFGYVGGGCCGYIAANILLRYWRSRGKISFSYKNVTQLTKDLISEGKKFGYGYSSWGGSIANVINSYARTKRFKAAAGSGIGSNYAYRELKNGKRPSILFGSLSKPTGNGKVKHAVVAYAVKVPKDTFNNFNTYICHYGWNGYAKVNISGGLIGSVTSFVP